MEAEVQAALNSVNAVYEEAAKRDILNALSEFCDLYPGKDTYVFHDGSSRLLVTLNGTIPVLYKGNTYHIPICLYLLDNHPYKAPMCYVRPTNDMMIKTSNHVDSNGRIYLPYLREWQYPQSDLLGLLQVMTIVFSDHCPVFSKPSSMHSSTPSNGAVPVGTNSSIVLGPSSSAVTSAVVVSSSSQPFTPSSVPLHSAYIPPVTAAATTSSLYNPYRGFMNAPVQTAPGIFVPSQVEHTRFNLLATVEEKLRTKLSNSMGTMHAELQSARKTHDDLNAGEEKLKRMLIKMGGEQEQLDSTISSLKEAIDEMDKILVTAGDGDGQGIDEAVDATTPLFRQLLSACAEDSALEDTIYFLGEAFKRGQFDLDNYLKHVRSLFRQQFILRATMERCRQVGGLPT